MIARGHDGGGGRGCGRGHNLGGGCRLGDNGPCHCVHCGKNNQTSDKCWDKFGKPKWAQNLLILHLYLLQLLSSLLLLSLCNFLGRQRFLHIQTVQTVS